MDGDDDDRELDGLSIPQREAILFFFPKTIEVEESHAFRENVHVVVQDMERTIEVTQLLRFAVGEILSLAFLCHFSSACLQILLCLDKEGEI